MRYASAGIPTTNNDAHPRPPVFPPGLAVVVVVILTCLIFHPQVSACNARATTARPVIIKPSHLYDNDEDAQCRWRASAVFAPLL